MSTLLFMNYYQLEFPIEDLDTRYRLIAALTELGCEAFEETDESLKAFFQEEAINQQEIDTLTQEFGIKYNSEMITPRNWNEEWERSFEPVTIPGFCTIRAGFHPPDDNAQYEIIITPKMSFGTGHHATTRLMIQAMQKLELKSKAVLDFGTGTGVLAILAHKMGAQPVVAIDNDEWSVENSLENIDANNAGEIEIILGSLEVVADRKFDLILANINRNILLENMANMKNILQPEGRVLLSGILTTDEKTITDAAIQQGFQKESATAQDNWMCMSFSL